MRNKGDGSDNKAAADGRLKVNVRKREADGERRTSRWRSRTGKQERGRTGEQLGRRDNEIS